MVQVLDASREAHARMSNRKTMAILDRIEAVVADACRRGVRDMSMREIRDVAEPLARQDYCEKQRANGFEPNEFRLEMNIVSARINELVKAGRLVRDTNNTRLCTVTGQKIHPLKVLPKQTSAFY